MPKGYAGKILRVDLTSGKISVEEPPESLYRKYLGGSALATHYLLEELPVGADPLGPENVLVISVGVLTGAPISGQSRVMANAKSPLTGAIGDAQGGGFWPAEFRFSGYDAIIFTGRSPKPVYLWIQDGVAALRDASHVWGKVTGEVDAALREELGDDRIEVLQIGPAGEKLVRFACIISMSQRACGRTGMGAVMGSKNLKAIAVRGHERPEYHDPDKIRELARWGRDHFEESGVYSLGLHGTAGGIDDLQRRGALPTRNWSSGSFEGWEKIWGQTMSDTILKKRDTCFGCVVRCKRVVETEKPFKVDPYYGGPEYETCASMGSYCGVDDLVAVAKANEICNMYGLDTISAGGAVAFAMDCYENGILTDAETGGMALNFGNGESLVKLVQMIADREGLGHLLAEGSLRAGKKIGKGAADLAVTCKGQEYPAHVPQAKRGLSLVYALNPYGACHMAAEHDPNYEPSQDDVTKAKLAQLDLHNPVHSHDLSAEKVRFVLTTQYVYSLLDCAGTCQFVWGPTWQLYSMDQLTEFVEAVTGWKTSIYELIRVGQRRLNMMRVFNAREGIAKEQDMLPPKGWIALEGGTTDGVAVDKKEWLAARELYYQMAGWDDNGVPTKAKLVDLDLAWVAGLL